MSTHGLPAPIDVVCGADSAYAPHLGVMLRSIANSNDGRCIRAHVLCDAIAPGTRDTVARCAPGLDITWYEIVNHQALAFKPLLQISRATYLRLLVAEILDPAIKRVLYLDIDIIVDADLRPLWETDLGGAMCAAVVDPGVSAAEFAEKWSLRMPGAYFNAGVMLFDLEQLREKSILQKAIAILADPNAHCDYADQDALNIVLWNSWRAVDPAWNFQRKFLYDDGAAWTALNPAPRRKPAIIHFTETDKPWRNSEWHPYAWLYLKTLLQTPFRSEVLRAGHIGVAEVLLWWARSIVRRPSIFARRRRLAARAEA